MIFLTIEVVMEGSNILVSLLNHPSQLSGLQLGPWWKKSGLYFFRNRCLKICKKYYEELFLCFCDYRNSDSRNKIDSSPKTQLTTNGKHPTATSIRDLNLYFCGKMSFKTEEIGGIRFLASSQCQYHRTRWCSKNKFGRSLHFCLWIREDIEKTNTSKKEKKFVGFFLRIKYNTFF